MFVKWFSMNSYCCRVVACVHMVVLGVQMLYLRLYILCRNPNNYPLGFPLLVIRCDSVVLGVHIVLIFDMAVLGVHLLVWISMFLPCNRNYKTNSPCRQNTSDWHTQIRRLHSLCKFRWSCLFPIFLAHKRRNDKERSSRKRKITPSVSFWTNLHFFVTAHFTSLCCEENCNHTSATQVGWRHAFPLTRERASHAHTLEIVPLTEAGNTTEADFLHVDCDYFPYGAFIN